mmetsp:Transcript_38333/g.61526  ORF Transcript_38333/g.61526 Transcript_38333/m.61526 type:complete len:187 (+) Transcript_38333:268-828(+)
MESVMLSALKFDLTVAYPTHFLERYIVRFCVEDTGLANIARFLTEMTLQKIEFLDFVPSMIAASAISFAFQIRGIEDWNDPLEKESGYSRGDLVPCKKEMMELLREQRPRYNAVREKYSSKKYGEVASFAIRKARDVRLNEKSYELGKSVAFIKKVDDNTAVCKVRSRVKTQLKLKSTTLPSSRSW